MGKPNEEIVAFLKKAKLGLDGIDWTRAKPRNDEVRTLAAAVRTALVHAPKVKLSPDDVVEVRDWLLGQIKGKSTTESALREASYAAITAFTPKPKAPRTVAPVTSDALAAAFTTGVKRQVARKRRVK